MRFLASDGELASVEQRAFIKIYLERNRPSRIVNFSFRHRREIYIPSIAIELAKTLKTKSNLLTIKDFSIANWKRCPQLPRRKHPELVNLISRMRYFFPALTTKFTGMAFLPPTSLVVGMTGSATHTVKYPYF